MNETKHLYETVFVLNPDLSEEDVEANVQNFVQLLENRGAEIIRIDRGGKRRLAYVMMVLDECTPYPATYDSARLSMEMTCRWARRCQEAVWDRTGGLFAIVQGSTYKSLRDSCVQTLLNSSFDGYAIGGLGVGEPRDVMRRVTKLSI